MTWPKAWLSAPQKVRDLFVPDEQNHWICPDCGTIGMSYKVLTCCNKACDRLLKHQHKAQPIPRLDQLVKMVKTNFWLLRVPRNSLIHVFSSAKFCCNADTPEEAVLKGICYENGFEFKEGKWMK